jgi:hypothetical protein
MMANESGTMATLPIKLFLSYCSTDRAFADKLQRALSTKDKFEIWYDQGRLQLGDSLVFSISHGLNRCDYGIALLSTVYMDSIWCQREFASMVALERTDKKIVLPIWHGVNLEQVTAFSPILGDRVAIRSDLPLDEIVLVIEAVVWGGQKAREIGDPLQEEYSDLADALFAYDFNARFKHSERGFALAAKEVSRLLEVFEKRTDQVKGVMQLQIKRRECDSYRLAPSITVSGKFHVNIEIGYLNRGFQNDVADNQVVVRLFSSPYNKQESLEDQRMAFYPLFTVNDTVQWRDVTSGTTYTSEEVVTLALTIFKDLIASRLKNS